VELSEVHSNVRMARVTDSLGPEIKVRNHILITVS
jgi:hypothetical protein